MWPTARDETSCPGGSSMTSTPEECRRAWSVTVPDETALAEAAEAKSTCAPQLGQAAR